LLLLLVVNGAVPSVVEEVAVVGPRLGAVSYDELREACVSVVIHELSVEDVITIVVGGDCLGRQLRRVAEFAVAEVCVEAEDNVDSVRFIRMEAASSSSF
jgi:hypothetical protein